MQSLMLISNPLKKVQKNLCEKSYQNKVTENGVFYFYYCVQKFSAYNFLFSWHFFQRIWTHCKILRYMILISKFWEKKTFVAYISTFANFKVKIGQNGSKKRKRYIMKVTNL